MAHNNKEVLEYWNQEDVESMYDKHLLNLEINLIKGELVSNSTILDAGCGEGEGTLAYSQIPGSSIHAVDFSVVRLKKAKKRLKNCKNVELKMVNFLSEYKLANDYDFIISQRFLINLMELKLQKKVLKDFKKLLRPGGRLIMLEGSVEGTSSLNHLRKLFNLEPIPIKWHNLFFKDILLEDYMQSIGFRLIKKSGLGTYFFLTRCIRPHFDKKLDWDAEFNRISSSVKLNNLFDLGKEFARLRLWVFEKV